MRNWILSTFVLICAIFFIGCNKSESPTEPVPNNNASIESVLNFQQSGDSLLYVLLTTLDTAKAKDSVLKYFLNNSDVEYGEISQQGISIKYKNGLIGGIMLDPLDAPDAGSYGFSMDRPIKLTKTKGNVPNSKKTIFINPHNYQRQVQAARILDSYIKNFTRVGLDYPEVYYDSNATVDVMTNLSGYGVIHIYSHGYAWPNMNNIHNIYLMTGERYTTVTSKKYKDEIKSAKIVVLSSGGRRYLWLSHSYFASKNDLSINRSLVYGGFCFSNLGGWPASIINSSKAGAYTGFTYAVRTNRNADWAIDLISHLTDNSREKPETVGGWFANSSIAKSYFDDEFQKTVEIQYTGNSNLALWEEELNIAFKISPDTLKTKVAKSNTFTAIPVKPITFSHKYKWDFGDGEGVQTGSTGNTASHSYKNPGVYNIIVNLTDQNNKVLSTSSAYVEVSDTSVINNNITKLDFQVKVSALIKYIEKANGVAYSEYTLEQQWIGGYGPIPITVNQDTLNQSSFSGTLNISGTEFVSVSGTYNVLQRTISMVFYYQDGTSTEGTIKRITVNNVPFSGDFNGNLKFHVNSPTACSYISEIFYENNVTIDMLRKEQKMLSFSCPESFMPWILIDLY